MKTHKILVIILLFVFVTSSVMPTYAWDSRLNQGYTLPTLKEMIKCNEKARAVLTMHELQKKGCYGEALEIAQSIYGSSLKITPFKVSNSVRMVHYSQEKYYYCCPAACRSVISVRNSNPPSQDRLASELGTTRNGTVFSSTIANVLNKYISSPQGYALKWYDGNSSSISTFIRSDIDYGYGALANGVSNPEKESYISGYPTDTVVYHYVAIYGYNNGSFSICDPAYGQYGFSITSKYTLPYNKFMNFIKERGIVW